MATKADLAAALGVDPDDHTKAELEALAAEAEAEPERVVIYDLVSGNRLEVVPETARGMAAHDRYSLTPPEGDDQ